MQTHKRFRTTTITMVRAIALLVFAVSWSVCLHGQTVQQSEQQDSSEALLKLQGEYSRDGRGIQVAVIGKDLFRVLSYAGGLPGDGWDLSEPQLAEFGEGELNDFLLAATKLERKSTSLGAEPPPDAIVLFDGTQASLDRHWNSGAKLANGNVLLAGCQTKERFRDYRLHLEFRTPFMPLAEGQGRGNSGVYHQARYETQVLDSFGFENESNTCGAIYGVMPAEFNACLPPLTWQTYDIEFTAARWDSNGKKLRDAKLTVWLNGKQIHRNQDVPSATTAAPNQESSEPGPLYLQDHGNPVTYRNIWIVPLDAEAAARRPRVAGFERLAAAGGSSKDFQLAGKVLIGELGCTSCHSPGSSANLVDTKTAPILSQVGSRLRPEYYANMLADLHQSKQGTTMPDLLHGLGKEEKLETISALSAFLQSTGQSRGFTRTNPQARDRGKKLFATIGCAVCHALPDETQSPATSISFPDLASKYTFDGLAAFLKQPHVVRPSNRMPGMHLSDDEAKDLASYLAPVHESDLPDPSTKYQLFEGAWQKLPDFESLDPVSTGNVFGFDVNAFELKNNFAARFDTYFNVIQPGKYRFFLESDDGSKLYIDGKLIVDVDGIHPPQTGTGELTLVAGFHQLRVDFFQGGGGAVLDVQIESDSVIRQSIDGWLQLDPTTPKESDADESPSASLIAKGKLLFQTTGCIQCHKVEGLATSPNSHLAKAPALDQLRSGQGCLSDHPAAKVPNYNLTSTQKQSIAAALANLTTELNHPEEQSKYTLAKLNCIACHQRNGWGGPESDRLSRFSSTIPEMGDEGRLPPLLTGIADKLNDNYLSRVLSEGARERPYMLVRMPKFSTATAGLAEHWKSVDRPSEDHPASSADEAESRTIANGRLLAGVKGLACAQCHTFGQERAIGIQAINMLTMTERLRSEWFYRYLLHPTKYRPGTRMPASFPDGTSVLKSVYDGNAEHQIAALWRYLSEGSKAATPDGLQRNQIILEAKDRPVIYRNFLEGLSARGIAVGYPGGLNIAWDAETMNIAKAWQGQFIDASMHWRDRGSGRQRPLGDLVLSLESTSPVAIVDGNKPTWPTAEKVAEDYRFKGYRLDREGLPTFSYKIGSIEVEDKPELVAAENGTPGLKRSLRVSHLDKLAGQQSAWIRLAEANKIVKDDQGLWQIDGNYKIKVGESIAAQVIQHSNSNGKQELILQLRPDSQASIQVDYLIRW